MLILKQKIIRTINNVAGKEIIKFLVAGVINTFATYLLYLFLLLFTQYQIAYAVAYVSGIIISFVLNTKIVFKTNMSIKKFLQYPSVYILQYLLNSLLLFTMVDKLLFNKKIAPLIVIMITIPFTFALSRFILKRD